MYRGLSFPGDGQFPSGQMPNMDSTMNNMMGGMTAFPGMYRLPNGEDPFFSGQMQQMQHMHYLNSMRNSMMGGGMAAHPGLLRHPQQAALMEHYARSNNISMEALNNQHQIARRQDPYAMYSSAHNPMSGVIPNMGHMQHDFNSMRNDPNANVYSSSSMMTISNTGNDGQPKVYQASSSVKQAPGGIRETTKTVRDSASGVQKISHGHHIGERGHVISRERNHETGTEEENQDYHNLDEEDANGFHAEFRERTNQYRPRGEIHQSIGHPQSGYANVAPSDRRPANSQQAIGYANIVPSDDRSVNSNPAIGYANIVPSDVRSASSQQAMRYGNY